MTKTAPIAGARLAQAAGPNPVLHPAETTDLSQACRLDAGPRRRAIEVFETAITHGPFRAIGLMRSGLLPFRA